MSRPSRSRCGSRAGSRVADRIQAGHEGPQFGVGGLARLTRCQSVQRERSNADTNQPQSRQADCRGHAANLAVAALTDLEFQPIGRDLRSIADGRFPWSDLGRRRQGARTRRARDAVIQQDAVLESLKRARLNAALDLGPIHFFHGVPRIGDARLETAIIGQQQQALTVVIQAPRRMETRRLQMVGQYRSILLR